VYITADVNITSKVKEPALPSVVVYYSQEEKLYLLGQMTYNFYQWEDYGTYLGNYHDSNNDFNYVETVKFAMGVSISEQIPKGSKLYIVAFDNKGFIKNHDKFRHPEIFYDWVGKKSLPSQIIANDFNGSLKLVKIKN